MSRCRWWLRRTEFLDPPLDPPFLSNQPCIVVVHVLFIRMGATCGGATGAVFCVPRSQTNGAATSHVVEVAAPSNGTILGADRGAWRSHESGSGIWGRPS